MSESPGCWGYILGLLRGGSDRKADDLSYRLREDFMSPAERSFYGVLAQVAGRRYTVLAKVRLADILYVPRSGNKGWASQQNKINQKHVDFLLCDPGTMAPVLAIELDDASHGRRDRAARDAFVDAAFAAAGLPLEHVPVKSSYAAEDIRGSLTVLTKAAAQDLSAAPFQSVLGTGSAMGSRILSSVKSQIEPLDATSVPKCPKCGEDMVLRIAANGKHKGERFYGCSQFPKCRGVALLNS